MLSQPEVQVKVRSAADSRAGRLSVKLNNENTQMRKGNGKLKSLINGAFRNKAAMIIIVIMVLAMGVLSYTKLPMEFLPEADNP